MIYNHCAASEYVPLIFQKDLGEEQLNKSNGDERYGIKWSCQWTCCIDIMTDALMQRVDQNIFYQHAQAQEFFWAIPGSIVHGILPDSM